MADSFMSRGAIIAGLVRQNVPREKAEREADRILAAEERFRATMAVVAGGRGGGKTAAIEAARAASSVPVPLGLLFLRIPWSALVSDNAKDRCACRGQGEAVRLTTQAYKDSLTKIQDIAREAMNGRPAATIPLALHARGFLPNTSRTRDVVNFSKALHDALSRVVYEDDSQLWDARWTRAGVDIDAPRAEITIRPFIPDTP